MGICMGSAASRFGGWNPGIATASVITLDTGAAVSSPCPFRAALRGPNLQLQCPSVQGYDRGL